VLGNETEGVNKRVMEMVDGVVEIPMYGVNSSLNVLVAASIVSYHAASRMDK
jgi:tRNA (guanosine-2'-O-)-methyltransferase